MENIRFYYRLVAPAVWANHTLDNRSYPHINRKDRIFLFLYISAVYPIFDYFLNTLRENNPEQYFLCISCTYLFEKVCANVPNARHHWLFPNSEMSDTAT